MLVLVHLCWSVHISFRMLRWQRNTPQPLNQRIGEPYSLGGHMFCERFTVGIKIRTRK